MLDDFKPYAVLLCGSRGVLAGIALVDIGQLDRVTRNLLHLLG